MQTVELSAILLAIPLLMFLMTAWSDVSHIFSLRSNKTQLKEMYVLDGNIEWMILAVECSKTYIDLEANQLRKGHKR